VSVPARGRPFRACRCDLYWYSGDPIWICRRQVRALRRSTPLHGVTCRCRFSAALCGQRLKSLRSSSIVKIIRILMIGVGMSFRITIEEDACCGAGQCVLAAPLVFGQRDEDGVVLLLDEVPPASERAAIDDAARGCPAGVIEVIE